MQSTTKDSFAIDLTKKRIEAEGNVTYVAIVIGALIIAYFIKEKYGHSIKKIVRRKRK